MKCVSCVERIIYKEGDPGSFAKSLIYSGNQWVHQTSKTDFCLRIFSFSCQGIGDHKRGRALLKRHAKQTQVEYITISRCILKVKFVLIDGVPLVLDVQFFPTSLIKYAPGTSNLVRSKSIF